MKSATVHEPPSAAAMTRSRRWQYSLRHAAWLTLPFASRTRAQRETGHARERAGGVDQIGDLPKPAFVGARVAATLRQSTVRGWATRDRLRKLDLSFDNLLQVS